MNLISRAAYFNLIRLASILVLPLMIFITASEVLAEEPVSSIRPNIITPDIEKFEADCAKGDADSCYKAGFTYVIKSEKQANDENYDFLAKKFLELGCEYGVYRSCAILVNYYIYMENTNKDYKKGMNYAKKSCDNDSGVGCAILAAIYKEGDVVKKNLSLYRKYADKAMKLLKRSCDDSSNIKRCQSEFCGYDVGFDCYAYARLNDGSLSTHFRSNKEIAEKYYCKACKFHFRDSCSDCKSILHKPLKSSFNKPDNCQSKSFADLQLSAVCAFDKGDMKKSLKLFQKAYELCPTDEKTKSVLELLKEGK